MRLSHQQEYLLLAGLAKVLRVLPRRWAMRTGASIGQLGWMLRVRRQLVLANLRQALPELDERSIRKTGSQAARNFGRTSVEFLRFASVDQPLLNQLVKVDGIRHLERGLAQGRGALLITGHLGAWALYFAAVAARGIPTALLVGRQHNEKVDQFLHSIHGGKVEFISKGRAAIPIIMKSLKQGKCVVMVADQHAGPRGIFEPFLGRVASTLSLPASFVAKYNVPLFLMIGARNPDKESHSVSISPIEFDPQESAQALKSEVTQRFNFALSQGIRSHPEQYFWYHRRWRDEDLKHMPPSGPVPANPS